MMHGGKFVAEVDGACYRFPAHQLPFLYYGCGRFFLVFVQILNRYSEKSVIIQISSNTPFCCLFFKNCRIFSVEITWRVRKGFKVGRDPLWGQTNYWLHESWCQAHFERSFILLYSFCVPLLILTHRFCFYSAYEHFFLMFAIYKACLDEVETGRQLITIWLWERKFFWWRSNVRLDWEGVNMELPLSEEISDIGREVAVDSSSCER